MSENSLQTQNGFSHHRDHAHRLNLLNVYGELEEVTEGRRGVADQNKVGWEDEGEREEAEAEAEAEEEEPKLLKFHHHCFRRQSSSQLPAGDRPWKILGKRRRHQE